MSHTVDWRSRIVCFVLRDGFRGDLVELLLFAFAVLCGFGHRRGRRVGGSSVFFGAAGFASELFSASLLLCASAFSLCGPLARARVHFLSVACFGWVVELARHAASFVLSLLAKAIVSDEHVRSTSAIHQTFPGRYCN